MNHKGTKDTKGFHKENKRAFVNVFCVLYAFVVQTLQPKN
jgi:hypothetical protein